MKRNFKDIATNYVALLLLILGAVNTYLQSTAGQPVNWQVLIGCILGAIVAWFTGKNPDASKKTDGQIQAQLNPKQVNSASVSKQL